MLTCMQSEGRSSCSKKLHCSARLFTISRFDGYPAHQDEYLRSRHRHDERSRATSSRTSEGRSTHATRSRHGSSRHVDQTTGYGSGYGSSRRSADRGTSVYSHELPHVGRRSQSSAATRASTLYPGDSISNAGRRPHRQTDAEGRGYSRASSQHYRQPTMEEYPPFSCRNSMYASTSSRQGSHSTRHSSTFASGPSHGYASPSRSHRTYETGSNVSSSTVTHPFAYDDSRATHIWYPPPRYNSSEASRRSRRSYAPPAESRTSYSRSAYGPHCSVASDGTLLPPCHVHGYPLPPTPVLRGTQGGSFSSIYSVMENVEDDSDVDHFA